MRQLAKIGRTASQSPPSLRYGLLRPDGLPVGHDRRVASFRLMPLDSQARATRQVGPDGARTIASPDARTTGAISRANRPMASGEVAGAPAHPISTVRADAVHDNAASSTMGRSGSAITPRGCCATRRTVAEQKHPRLQASRWWWVLGDEL